MVQTVLVTVDDLDHVHGDVQDDTDQVDDSVQERDPMVQVVLVAAGGLDLVHGDAQDDADQVGDSGQEGRPLQIGREMMVRTISWGLIVVKRFCRNKKSFSSQKEGFI